VSEQPLEDLLARLERERQEADRNYNDALTAVDRAIAQAPELPSVPPAYDEAMIAAINEAWDILRDGQRKVDGFAASDTSLKGRLRAFVWRVVGPYLETQKRFNAALVDHINRNVAAHRDAQRTIAELVDAFHRQHEALVRFESLLVQYLQTITFYVDTKDRIAGGSEIRERLALAEQRMIALKRDVERVSTSATERAPTATAPGVAANSASPASSAVAFQYVEFENRFRGSQEEIRRRLDDYLSILGSAPDVLDVGCGRGELLDLLRDRGIRARGIDANQAMVDLCRARRLDVEKGDALGFLQGQQDGAIGALVAIQVVEHFEAGYLQRFLETAYKKMRAGAPLLLETINPACWMAFFECYLRDLTHSLPLHPETLRYLVQAAGFVSVDVQYRQPVRDVDRLDRVGLPAGSSSTDTVTARLVAAVDAHADKLNARLFSSMDYAVIARR
jgi:O-antigen chain-terminating methyltransferase